MGVAVSDRPVGKRITDRYQMDVPSADSTVEKCENSGQSSFTCFLCCGDFGTPKRPTGIRERRISAFNPHSALNPYI